MSTTSESGATVERLTKAQQSALEEINTTLVRVWRTRRTRVASSGHLEGKSSSGRRFSAGMVSTLLERGLIEVCAIVGAAPSFLVLTDRGREAIR